MSAQVKVGIDIRKIHDFLINKEFITLEVNIFFAPNIIILFVNEKVITIDIVFTIMVIVAD